MSEGVIRLYLDNHIIISLRFYSLDNRKALMKILNETYQLNRQRKIVYYELTAA